MSNYFCPECGYEGDEPICPHCNIPTEKLDVSDDMANEANGAYPEGVVDKVKDEDDLEKEELEDENIEEGSKKSKDSDEEI